MRITVGNQVEANIPGGVVINSGNVTASIPGGVTVNSGHVTADVTGSVEITNASINANVTGDVNVTNGNINITDSAERLLGKTNLTKSILLADNATITTTTHYVVSIDNAKTIMVLLKVKNLLDDTGFNMVIWARQPGVDLRAVVDVTPWSSDIGHYNRVYNAYTNYYEISLQIGGTTPSMTFDLGVVLRS